MKKIKHALGGLLGVVLALSGQQASAELLSIKYINANGVEQDIATSSKFHNPQSNLSFILSAGLDRKVRVSLLDASGDVVAEKVSHLLGIEDRMNVRGTDYYAAELGLPIPSDGDYQVKAQIIASDGREVQADLHDFFIDTVSPIISGDVTRRGRGTNLYSTSRQNVYLQGFSDEGSGLDRAEYITIDRDGVRRSVDVEIISDSNAMLAFGNVAANWEILPEDHVLYDVGFAVYDKAGNLSEKTKPMAGDRSFPIIDEQIYNDKTGVWEDYAHDMTIHTNPVRMRYVRSLSDHAGHSEGSFGWTTGGNIVGDKIYNELSFSPGFKY